MVSVIEILVGIILAITLLLIIFERMHKTLAAVLGAGAAIFLAILPIGEGGKVYLPGIEFLFELIEVDLLFVIIGMTLMVGVARKTGIFDYIAIVVLKKSGNNQFKLLTALSLLTMVFSAFLDAYMAILIVGSITLVSCQALDINPKPYLLAEAIFGDLGGTVTRIASPPNLIIGGHYDIDFVTFFVLTAPFALVAALITLLIWAFFFRKDLSRQISEFEYARILLIDEKIVIADPKSFRNAAIILLATIIGFAIASFLPFTLDLGFIALAGGFAMVGFVEIDVEEALRTIELPLVFFLAGLLTIIGIAEETGVLELIAAPVEILFSLNLFGGVIALLWVNALASAVLDNVPVASIMTGVMDRLMVDYPSIPFSPLLLSVVIGTNLGGNITPIGSASTVQAIEMLHRSERIDAKASFLEFVKYGGMVTFGQLIVGSIYIGLIWTIGTIFSM